MTQSVKLVSVASAVPPYILEQRDVAAAAHRAFALRYTDFERLARVFKTSGIRRRDAVCPMEWYFQPLGWPERSSAYRGVKKATLGSRRTRSASPMATKMLRCREMTRRVKVGIDQ